MAKHFLWFKKGAKEGITAKQYLRIKPLSVIFGAIFKAKRQDINEDK